SHRPLHALWEFSTNPAAAALITEFTAPANHRKSIRSELAAYGQRYLHAQHEVLSAAEREGRVDLTDVLTRVGGRPVGWLVVGPRRGIPVGGALWVTARTRRAYRSHTTER